MYGKNHSVYKVQYSLPFPVSTGDLGTYFLQMGGAGATVMSVQPGIHLSVKPGLSLL